VNVGLLLEGDKIPDRSAKNQQAKVAYASSTETAPCTEGSSVLEGLTTPECGQSMLKTAKAKSTGQALDRQGSRSPER